MTPDAPGTVGHEHEGTAEVCAGAGHTEVCTDRTRLRLHPGFQIRNKMRDAMSAWVFTPDFKLIRDGFSRLTPTVASAKRTSGMAMELGMAGGGFRSSGLAREPAPRGNGSGH